MTGVQTCALPIWECGSLNVRLGRELLGEARECGPLNVRLGRELLGEARECGPLNVRLGRELLGEINFCKDLGSLVATNEGIESTSENK